MIRVVTAFDEEGRDELRRLKRRKWASWDFVVAGEWSQSPYLPGGLLFLNTSLVHEPPTRTDITRIEVKANDVAEDLGDIRIANLVVLGAFLGKTGVVSLESVLAALKQVLPARRHSLIPLNENALKRGAAVCAHAVKAAPTA